MTPQSAWQWVQGHSGLLILVGLVAFVVLPIPSRSAERAEAEYEANPCDWEHRYRTAKRIPRMAQVLAVQSHREVKLLDSGASPERMTSQWEEHQAQWTAACQQEFSRDASGRIR